MPILAGCFVSDLHLLSPRSVAHALQGSIDAACDDCGLIVLGGDIFDFRWANVGGHGYTLSAAQSWLESLIESNPSADVVYVLGNHDSHPDMQALLSQLSTTYSNFQWSAETWRRGDCLFCHGDILDAGSQARLAGYRRKFHHVQPASRAAHGIYDAAVAMRLHRTIPKLFHRPRSTCTRLLELLDFASHPEWHDIRRVFFGHTHVPIYELPLGQIEFYNPGAALKHMNFAPITFHIHS